MPYLRRVSWQGLLATHLPASLGLIEERVGQGVLLELTRLYRNWLMVWIYLDLLALGYQ
jgi:hypothetical protein